MNKYYSLFFFLFFLSVASQNDVMNIKKMYESISSYNLDYSLIISTQKDNQDVKIIEESGTMFGNNSSFKIKHENMDVISDGKKIYNIIHNIKEINITEYSENNLWNPVYIFKNFLERINSDLITQKKDYIKVKFLDSDLERTYTFFLDKNYNIFKLELNTEESKSKTTILINKLQFTDETFNINFDNSIYKEYYLNFL
ncbi:MAG: hypothetical protein CMC66_01215 [Flavobacteriaceae bacterium]|nr:hypothetical protein [Flavobacteriaceae bacterium]